MSMNTVQFDPKIATDLQIDWRRHAPSQGTDPFADLLADRLRRRVESEQGDSDARRRHTVSEPVSGRPPRVALGHARTLRGEAKEADGAPDRRLIDQPRQASGDGCGEVAKDTPAPDEDTVDADATAGDETAETQTDTEAAVITDQPVRVAANQAQPTDPAATIVVATQPAPEDTASISPEMPALLPTPAPLEGRNAAPGQTDQAQNAAPDGSQANTDSAPEQQAAAAMAEADLSAAVAALTTGDTTATDGKDMPSLAPAQPAALPSTPAAAEQPLAQIAEAMAPIAADLAPQATRPKSARPALDIKPRPATPTRANAGMTDPVPSSAPVSQPTQAHQTALLPASGSSEFGGTGDMLEQPFSDDGSGQGWALHLAQGAAGKRADFVAQLRQHLQNLPAHEQVAVHIQRALREGTGKFSIQLSPAELGGIHVKLEIDEDKRVTAAVTVERPSTLELLQCDVKGLERALHNAGLNMEGGDLSFSLGHGGDQDFAQDMNQPAASPARGAVLDGQSEGDQPDSLVAQVMDTAAGVVNLQV
jgi:flagellar hook-length control protein FliK